MLKTDRTAAIPIIAVVVIVVVIIVAAGAAVVLLNNGNGGGNNNSEGDIKNPGIGTTLEWDLETNGEPMDGKMTYSVIAQNSTEVIVRITEDASGTSDGHSVRMVIDQLSTLEKGSSFIPPGVKPSE